MQRRRAQISGGLFILGSVTFWASWALMPMPGTSDAAFILDAVSAVRRAVLVSTALQLISAAAWAAALVLTPAPSGERGQLAWWGGACLLAIGVTGSSADAIYHLVAYELTDPTVAQTLALPVMTKFQGPDLMLLLPSIGAFFAGLGLYAIAGVQAGRLPRAALGLFAAAVVAAAAGALLPGLVAPRVAALSVLACAIAPLTWMGWVLVARANPDHS